MTEKSGGSATTATTRGEHQSDDEENDGDDEESTGREPCSVLALELEGRWTALGIDGRVIWACVGEPHPHDRHENERLRSAPENVYFCDWHRCIYYT